MIAFSHVQGVGGGWIKYWTLHVFYDCELTRRPLTCRRLSAVSTRRTTSTASSSRRRRCVDRSASWRARTANCSTRCSTSRRSWRAWRNSRDRERTSWVDHARRRSGLATGNRRHVGRIIYFCRLTIPLCHTDYSFPFTLLFMVHCQSF